MREPPKVGNATDDMLRGILRQSAWGVAFAAGVGLLVNMLFLIMPLYMMQVYNRVLVGRSLDTLAMLTIVALTGLTFAAVFDYIRARAFIIIGERLARRLGVRTLRAAIRDSLRSSSATAANAMRDLQELRQFITSGPVAVPFELLMAPVFLSVLYLLHPAYCIVAVIAIVLLGALSAATEILIKRPAALANEAAVKSNAEVVTAIRHAEVIESMGMLGAMARRWKQGQSRALFLVGAGNTGAKALHSLAKLVRMAMQIVMLATGATLVIKHEASAGSLLASVMMMSRVLLPFEKLIEGWRQWSHASSALARLRTLIASDGDDRASVPVEAAPGTLRIDHVGFIPAGADRPVLKGVSFAVEPGEVIGIIGPSGAGKSTLARLIVGLWKPTTGGIYFDGHDVYTWERESFGRQIGYLPQDPALLGGTIRDNICRFSECQPEEVISAAKRAGVHELIGRLPRGYETVINEGAYVLSGGQRQRIALARALFGSPRLLVLDEPNSNMDGEGEQAFLRALEQAKQEGACIIIIAQRTSILSAADRLLVMRDGAVDRIGERTEVLKSLMTQAAPRSGDGMKVARLPVARTPTA